MRQNKVGGARSFSRFGLSSLILILCISSLHAGSFENFKRSQVESFKKYQDERDNAFRDYLKEQFQAYLSQPGMPLYEKPKPSLMPKASEQSTKPVGPRTVITVPPKIKEPEGEVKKEKEQEVVVEVVEKKDIYFDFYGSELGFNIPKGIKNAKFYPQNQKGIAAYFNAAASSYHTSLIKDIQKVSKEMNLNDWGIYQLVLKISNSVYTDQDNVKLLSWFIFNKLGYAVKIGLVKQHVVLMHYSEKVIYSTPSYSFGKKKYYVISNYAKGSVGRLFSYKHDYPGSIKPLDLTLKRLPMLASNIQSKTLSFEEFGKRYEIPFEYNKNIIDFMSTYPQADYETFFNAPLEDKTYESIAIALKKLIDGKRASAAMNFVLSFVQKSFKYELDEKQFGREKVMFAQETLYFDKSDCEDRAVLYSYLIKELFHVPVLGVKYKDHMATALYIPMDGDSIKAGTRKFIIADPTYVNATIGMSMPKYRSIKPESYIIVENR